MKKNNHIFWVSYSDLMTSMFFIMLVLFVLTIGYLKSVLDATQEELDKIKEIQTSVQKLPETYFEYQPEYKRFILKKDVHFDSGSARIHKKYREYLVNVGRSIENLINTLKNDKNKQDMDIKYLVVIEGMASKDGYKYNYELSYKRALALYRLWLSKNIHFDPKICEVQIAGSGIGGIREFTGKNEKRNQRFLIHIIPKIGKIN